jgi:hypothetical protein
MDLVLFEYEGVILQVLILVIIKKCPSLTKKCLSHAEFVKPLHTPLCAHPLLYAPSWQI